MIFRATGFAPWQGAPRVTTVFTMIRTAATPLAAALLAAFVLLAAPAARAETVIGVFDAWSAFTETEGGSKICYIGAVPDKAEGDYTQRGKTYVIVTHRPAEGTRDEVSVRAGYTYQSASAVEVRVGAKRFTLSTQGGHAWASDADDPKLVAAMRAGADMVIKGRSSRGTLTTDTYSLIGFTAAYNAASRACGL
jgi:invasion protein IalB